MGQVVEEFKWAKSHMRAHTLLTGNIVFIGTLFNLHCRKVCTLKIGPQNTS
jgi:hypothetical protein